MGNDNKVDLTKLTKSQSTGKNISDRFQQQVKVMVNNALCPQGRNKQELLSLEKAQTFYNDSWKSEWAGFDSYIHFQSASNNQIVLGFGFEFILALANLHLGGEFERQQVNRQHVSTVEKKLLSEISHKIVNKMAHHYKAPEWWKESLQSSHVEMIHKKIPNKKYFEARFLMHSELELGADANDLLIACLFTKQNPMS